MSTKLIFDLNNKNTNRFSFKINDIKNMKDGIELSLDRLIHKIELAIENEDYEEGKKNLVVANSIHKNNSKINSLEIILYGKDILKDYSNILSENNKELQIYNFYNLEKRINELIKKTVYFESVDVTEEYKVIFKELKAIRKNLFEKNLNEKINEVIKNINNIDDFLILINKIFGYDNNFYNSLEFKFNIIENEIYVRLNNIDEVKRYLQSIYLLYKFNLEEDLYDKINMLYNLDIYDNGYLDCIEYKNIYINLSKDKYFILKELKNEVNILAKSIEMNENKSMPI